MKPLRLLAGAAVAMAMPMFLICQPTPQTGFHQVQCLKVKPDKGADFRKWAEGDLHKYAQALVDSGRLSAWVLVRSVVPTGSATACDYYIVGIYPGLPPEPLSPEGLGPLLKKAGLTMTAEDFAKGRDAVVTLVSNGIWQNVVSEGSLMQKGDYLVVNEMKAANPDEWIAMEKRVWQPMAALLDKDGITRGWSVNVLILPERGTDIAVNGVTVDIYPSWDAAIKFATGPDFYDRWKKVHPDMEVGTTFEGYDKVRVAVSAHFYKVDEMVSAAK